MTSAAIEVSWGPAVAGSMLCMLRFGCMAIGTVRCSRSDAMRAGISSFVGAFCCSFGRVFVLFSFACFSPSTLSSETESGPSTTECPGQPRRSIQLLHVVLRDGVRHLLRRHLDVVQRPGERAWARAIRAASVRRARRAASERRASRRACGDRVVRVRRPCRRASHPWRRETAANPKH
jgi:hypothetical protein